MRLLGSLKSFYVKAVPLWESVSVVVIVHLTVISYIPFTFLFYAMMCDVNDALGFQCKAIRFVCYVMRDLNEGLNDKVCYAMVCYVIWTKMPSHRRVSNISKKNVGNQSLRIKCDMNINFLNKSI